MGDRITTFKDCPKCGAVGQFECYEALSSNMKLDNCEACGHTHNYIFKEKGSYVDIIPAYTCCDRAVARGVDTSAKPMKSTNDKINWIVRSNPAVVQNYDEASRSDDGIPKLITDIRQLIKETLQECMEDEFFYFCTGCSCDAKKIMTTKLEELLNG